MLGIVVQNVVVTVTLCLRFVHSWSILILFQYSAEANLQIKLLSQKPDLVRFSGHDFHNYMILKYCLMFSNIVGVLII